MRKTKTNDKKELPACCVVKDEKDCCSTHNKDGLGKGILYGLIPHIGCIAFVIFSVLGMTAFASVFKPLLYKAYFFYIMIGVSLILATFSAYFYLKRCNCLSKEGIKKKRNYLSILYGTTIGVGLIFYFVIFPLVGATTASTGQAINTDLNMTIKVSIPCEGHAPLITSELQKISGVNAITYLGNYKFQISYNADKVSKDKILAAEIFKEYPAKEI